MTRSSRTARIERATSESSVLVEIDLLNLINVVDGTDTLAVRRND